MHFKSITLISFMILLLTACGSEPQVLVVTATSTDTPAVGAEQATSTPETAVENTPTPIPVPTDPPISADPQIGNIVFAPEVDGDTPLNASDTFTEGLAKVYAVFDFAGMSDGDEWERVWYLDDEELLRSVEAWTAGENGAYPYFLDGGGDALPSGIWRLELYVNGERLDSAEFEITAPPTATPSLTSEVKPTSTRRPSSTPTPTTQAAAPARARQHRLVFSRWDGMDYSLYVGDTNGNSEIFVINRATAGSFSLDGKQLYFFAQQGVNQQFREGRLDCVFNTISGGVVAIDVRSPLGDICAVHYGEWACERKPGVRDVCFQDGVRVYQNLDWKEGTARYAQISPDGRLFAYDARPGGEQRIYFQNITNDQREPFELVGEQSSWSPNGQQLVYRSGRDNQIGIWISNRDDTGYTLMLNDGAVSFPTWSPNGREIAYARDNGGNVDIYVMNVDGSNIRQLTNAPGPDTLPVYTPSGEIVFRSARNGQWDIWKMSGNGANQRILYTNTGLGPDWTFGKMSVY